MYILNKDHEIIEKEIYDGRNSEWFNNLRGRGWDSIYDYLPIKYGIPELFPIPEEKLIKEHYYDFQYITVKDFKEWYKEFRPDIDAGWVQKYDAWAYRKKGIIPNLNHYLYVKEDERIEDFEFIEVENKYDNSRWLYEYIKKEFDDSIIFYYFDC